ncbi:MAG: hypothetical protein PHT33_15520, partial [bacterium]|nr:hypothetical protein [bacterium]
LPLEFCRPPAQSLVETFQDKSELTEDMVRGMICSLFWQLAKHIPQSIQQGEIQSAQINLDMIRYQILQTMYRRIGVEFLARCSHMSKLFPEEWLQQINATYLRENENPADVTAIANAMFRAVDIWAGHLRVLSGHVAGEWPEARFNRLYSQVIQRLNLCGVL